MSNDRKLILYEMKKTNKIKKKGKSVYEILVIFNQHIVLDRVTYLSTVLCTGPGSDSSIMGRARLRKQFL